MIVLRTRPAKQGETLCLARAQPRQEDIHHTAAALVLALHIFGETDDHQKRPYLAQSFFAKAAAFQTIRGFSTSRCPCPLSRFTQELSAENGGAL